MKHYGLHLLLLAFFLMAFPWTVFGADSDPSLDVSSLQKYTDIYYSDQYFTTANRRPSHKNKITDNMTIITREELDRWPVNDLEDALGMINGIVVQKAGGLGQTAVAQMAASKPRDVRVMVDGITFNATTTGGIADLSQIPLEIVEKIEIIKGAASSTWGSAMGGVINIITRAPGKNVIPEGRLGTIFGERDTQREHGEMSGRLGPLRYYGMGAHAESDGFRPQSAIFENRSFGKIEVPLTKSTHLVGAFGHSFSDIGEFELPDIGTKAKRKVLSRYGNAGLIFQNDENMHSELLYKISERTFRRDTRILATDAFFQLSKAQSMIHEVSYSSAWNITENQTLVLGSDVGIEKYHDAVFRLTTTRANVNKESLRHAYYLNYQLSWWKFDLSSGSRLDATNSYGTNFDPSFGIAYHLPFWEGRLRANVARAFNAPSLVDRYLSAGSTIANPDLKAEHAIVYNVGPEFTPRDRVFTKAVFFQSFIEDSIQSVLLSNGFSQPQNILQERRTGFETELRLGPIRGISASYETNYSLAVDANDVPLQSRPLFTQDIKLNYEKSFREFHLNTHLAGRWMDVMTYTNSGFTDPVDQALMVYGKAKVTLPRIFYGNASFFLQVNNLWSRKFAFDGQRNPEPRSNFEFGIEYHF